MQPDQTTILHRLPIEISISPAHACNVIALSKKYACRRATPNLNGNRRSEFSAEVAAIIYHWLARHLQLSPAHVSNACERQMCDGVIPIFAAVQLFVLFCCFGFWFTWRCSYLAYPNHLKRQQEKQFNLLLPRALHLSHSHCPCL